MRVGFCVGCVADGVVMPLPTRTDAPTHTVGAQHEKQKAGGADGRRHDVLQQDQKKEEEDWI